MVPKHGQGVKDPKQIIEALAQVDWPAQLTLIINRSQLDEPERRALDFCITAGEARRLRILCTYFNVRAGRTYSNFIVAVFAKMQLSASPVQTSDKPVDYGRNRSTELPFHAF